MCCRGETLNPRIVLTKRCNLVYAAAPQILKILSSQNPGCTRCNAPDQLRIAATFKEPCIDCIHGIFRICLLQCCWECRVWQSLMGSCLMQGCILRNIPDRVKGEVCAGLIPCFGFTGGRRSNWGWLAGLGASEKLKLHCRHKRGWCSSWPDVSW